MIRTFKKLFFSKLIVALEDEYLDLLIKDEKYKRYDFVVALTYRNLELRDFDRLTKTTAIIDLYPASAEIFSSFNDTTRNEIRRTENNDRLSFVAEDKNLNRLYDLYKKFEFSQGRVPIDLEEFKEYPIFSAYFDGEPISAISVFTGGKQLRIRSIFSKRLSVNDKEMYKAISNATRRIVWEICRWGKERGYISLDMASVNLDNPKTASIARFKMNFGGTLVKEYTYLYRSGAFRFFERFVAIPHFFKKLSARIVTIIK